MSDQPLKELKVHQILIRFWPGRIVELLYPDEFDLNLTEAKEIDDIIQNETNLSPFKLLINFENSYGSMSHEVQDFFAHKAPTVPYIEKSAIVLNNLGVRLLVKFYLRFFKPSYPSQIFGSKEAALNWLNSL